MTGVKSPWLKKLPVTQSWNVYPLQPADFPKNHFPGRWGHDGSYWIEEKRGWAPCVTCRVVHSLDCRQAFGRPKSQPGKTWQNHICNMFSDRFLSKVYRMGPPVDSVQLVYKWLNSMVYGRYNELVFMGIISWFINQRSHHWGGPSYVKTMLFCGNTAGGRCDFGPETSLDRPGAIGAITLYPCWLVIMGVPWP